MIKTAAFGTAQDRKITKFTIDEGDLSVDLINYGGSVAAIRVGGTEVTLGFDEISPYEKYRTFFGATVGRVANRVGGVFELFGKHYELEKNEKNNCLHGGREGFDRQVFDCEVDGDGVMMKYLSPDGSGGFPGNLDMTVRYAVIDGALDIEYTATCDLDTLWAPTNHTFFNLSGGCGNIYDTMLMINGDYYTPVNKDKVPTGELRPVRRTPFDFTSLKRIGEGLTSRDSQIALAMGFDHNYALSGMRAATAVCESSGIALDVYTDMPGLQLYTGNYLGSVPCRGMVFGKHCAFCLEAQYFPNAINISGFDPPILKKGETKRHYIRYVFSHK